MSATRWLSEWDGPTDFAITVFHTTEVNCCPRHLSVTSSIDFIRCKSVKIYECLAVLYQVLNKQVLYQYQYQYVTFKYQYQ